MDEHGHRQCTPRQNNPKLELEDWLDFSSGYIRRKIHMLPKQGTQKPWKLDQNYLVDRKMIGNSKINDGVMEFTAPTEQVAVGSERLPSGVCSRGCPQM